MPDNICYMTSEVTRDTLWIYPAQVCINQTPFECFELKLLFFNCARWIVYDFFSELQKIYNQRFWVGIIKLLFGQLLVRYLIYFARENRYYALLNLAPNICSPLPNNALVNSKHQLIPGEFLRLSNSCPRAENFCEITARDKKVDKNPAPGDNFVDLQDNFAMIVKPFTFFWYSSLTWLSSSFSKITKLANTKFLSDSSIPQFRFDMYGKN